MGRAFRDSGRGVGAPGSDCERADATTERRTEHPERPGHPDADAKRQLHVLRICRWFAGGIKRTVCTIASERIGIGSERAPM